MTKTLVTGDRGRLEEKQKEKSPHPRLKLVFKGGVLRRVLNLKKKRSRGVQNLAEQLKSYHQIKQWQGSYSTDRIKGGKEIQVRSLTKL